MKIGTLAGWLMLVAVLAGCADRGSSDDDIAIDQGGPKPSTVQADTAQSDMVTGVSQQDGAQQALQGLFQIRQEQCKSGNQLACEDLSRFPRRGQQLAQLSQACQSGDGEACAAHSKFAEDIFTAYSESAAVMQNGREAMAQMDAWRAQMNRNAASSMANLRAQGAAGQAAHEARQQSYDAMNNSWQAGQDSGDISQQQRVDQIYEQERCADGRLVSIHVGC